MGFTSPFYRPEILKIMSLFFCGPENGNHNWDITFPWIFSRRFLFFPIIELEGRGFADYRSLIGPETDLDNILEKLRQHRKSFVIELDGIAEKDPSNEIIENWISKNKLIVHRAEGVKAPFINIGSWDEYKASKRRKFWYNISRSEKFLEAKSGNLFFEILQKPELITSALPSCMALYNSSWTPLNSSSIYTVPKGQAFLTNLLENLSAKGNAEICVMKQEGTLLAFCVALKFDQSYHFYLFSTNKQNKYARFSIGKIFLKKLLKSVFEREYKIFDFMAGEEPYKFEWTKTSQKRTTYLVTDCRPFNRFLVAFYHRTISYIAMLKSNPKIRRLFDLMAR